MRAKWTGQNLFVAVQRYNAMIEGLNKAAPLVSAILDNAKVTESKVGKRERAKIADILEVYLPQDGWTRCYLDTNYTTGIYLKADISAPVSDHGCAYAETSVCVASRDYQATAWSKVEVVPAELKTLDEIQGGIADAEQAEEREREAISAAHEARNAIRAFINS